jgi:excisionase family DNA binding protein
MTKGKGPRAATRRQETSGFLHAASTPLRGVDLYGEKAGPDTLNLPHHEGLGKKYLTPIEAKNITRLGLTTIYGLLQRGDLRASKISRQWRIAADDLDAFMMSRQFIPPNGGAVSMSKVLNTGGAGQKPVPLPVVHRR